MNTATQNTIEFTRVNNDVNGNPRYVCHYSNIPLNDNDRTQIANTIFRWQSMGQNTIGMQIKLEYELAVIKAKLIGGKKFHNKQYGGGIVFQSYNIGETERHILELVNS